MSVPLYALLIAIIVFFAVINAGQRGRTAQQQQDLETLKKMEGTLQFQSKVLAEQQDVIRKLQSLK